MTPAIPGDSQGVKTSRQPLLVCYRVLRLHVTSPTIPGSLTGEFLQPSLRWIIPGGFSFGGCLGHGNGDSQGGHRNRFLA
jgi:hypothetical protein